MDRLKNSLFDILLAIQGAARDKTIRNREDMYGIISNVLQGHIKKNPDFRGAGFNKNYTFNRDKNNFKYYDHNVFGDPDEGTIDLDQLIPHHYLKTFENQERPAPVDSETVNRKKYPNIYKIKDVSLQAVKKHDENFKNAEKRNYNMNDVIKLTSGKFNNVKVPRDLINEIVTQADAAGLDRQTALGLIGQESTFGEGINPDGRTKRKNWGGDNSYSPVAVASYWKGSYETPLKLNYLDYLARKGAKVEKDPERTGPHSLELRLPLNEQDSINTENLLKNNPKIIELFTNNVNNYNYEIPNLYKQAFQYYKAGRYNSNDPNHNKDVLHSGMIAASDPQLKQYLK